MSEKIKTNELVEEIKLALQDTFVAELQSDEEGILLRFLNGQKFRLRVESIS